MHYPLSHYIRLTAIASVFLINNACSAASTYVASNNTNMLSATINPLHPYDENADAAHDITAALASAQVDHKYVLLDFGGNWCPDCIVLAKYYEIEPLKSYVGSNYHIVPIDVGMFNKNTTLDTQYGDPIKAGVPAVVVLDPSGKIVGSTADGALESASTMTLPQVMAILQKWPSAHG